MLFAGDQGLREMFSGDAPLTDQGHGRSSGDRARLVYHGLVRAILEHRLPPGTKLGEDDIGQIYGVSRTIVRSALQALAHDGIAVIEKNRGAFVASPSPQDAREVFEMRKLIEPMLAARAAERSTPDAIALLRRHAQAEQEASARNDQHAAIRLSGEFHRMLARMAGQRLAETILAELIGRSSLIIMLYRRANAPSCADTHHTALIEAVDAGDSERAAHLMAHHLDDIAQELELETASSNEAFSLSAVLGGA